MQILRFINSKLIIQKHIYATKVGQLTYMCNMYQEQQISRVVCELKLVSNQVTKICEVVQAIQESSGATSININNFTHQPLQELLRADFPSIFFFFSFFLFFSFFFVRTSQQWGYFGFKSLSCLEQIPRFSHAVFDFILNTGFSRMRVLSFYVHNIIHEILQFFSPECLVNGSTWGHQSHNRLPSNTQKITLNLAYN